MNFRFAGTKAHCEAKQDELELSDEDTEVIETADEDNATNLLNDTMDGQEDDPLLNVKDGIGENPHLINDTGNEKINDMVAYVLNDVTDAVTNMPNTDKDKPKGEQGKNRKRKLLKVTLLYKCVKV